MLGTARSTDWNGSPITIKGELDENGEACGQGTATYDDYPDRSFKGTFYEN